MKFVCYTVTALLMSASPLLGDIHNDLVVNSGEEVRKEGGDVNNIFVNNGTLFIDGDVRTHGSIFINDSAAHLIIAGDLDARGDIFLTRGKLRVEGTLSMQLLNHFEIRYGEVIADHFGSMYGLVTVSFGLLTVHESSKTNDAFSIHVENSSRFVTSGVWSIGRLTLSGATLQSPSPEYQDIHLRTRTLDLQKRSIITTAPQDRREIETRDGGSVSIYTHLLYLDGTIAADGEQSITSDPTLAGHGGKVFVQARHIDSFTGSIFATGKGSGGNGGIITVRSLDPSGNTDDIPRSRLHADGSSSSGGISSGQDGKVSIQTAISLIVDRTKDKIFVSFVQPVGKAYTLEQSTDGGLAWSAVKKFDASAHPLAERVFHEIPVSEQAGAAMFRLVVGD